MFDGGGSLFDGVVPGGRGRRFFWRHAAAQEAAPGVRRGELSGYLSILVCYGPGATRRTSGRGPGPWAPLGPSDAAAARGPAARAQALHAIEQTQLGIRGTEFHWPRLAGCGSIKASPAARQQPPPHSAFV